MTSNLIANKFTKQFGLTIPIALAPMALASGGKLAAASARSGTLALIGGGYGDLEWTKREYLNASNILAGNKVHISRLGCGFITWRLYEDQSAFDWLLDQAHKPAAVMLSFGDPTKFGKVLKHYSIPLICQIQTISQLPRAVSAGADVIVAQGAEAGGHGMNSLDGRSTFTLVPEIADWLAKHAPSISLLAAGGISDGRGLAAALMLGADGALVGSRLWASSELLAPNNAKVAAVKLGGDMTARSGVFDILRTKTWPKEFDFRAVRNQLHRKWESHMGELQHDPSSAIQDYLEGVSEEDYDRAHITVGESIGLIHDIPSAKQVIERMNEKAMNLLCSDNITT